MSAKASRAARLFMPTRITRTETDEETGEETEQRIPFLKGYTVFNVEQIEGLPAHFYAAAEPRLDPVQRIERAESFFAGNRSRHPAWRQSWLTTISATDLVQMPPFESLPRRRKLLRHARA